MLWRRTDLHRSQTYPKMIRLVSKRFGTKFMCPTIKEDIIAMNLLQRISRAVSKNSLSNWEPNPIIYEINTWVWLRDLSKYYGEDITLANVPDEVIKELATYRFDAIWMMGVWHRSKATRDSALNYIHEYEGALPDITKDDVPGSAYSIGGYYVEPQIGGRAGLATFREQLQHNNMKLILDYVPNHVSTDHPWIYDHPEYFVQGTKKEADDPSIDFFHADTADGKGVVVARGRDPYFPPWIDTAQLNAYHPAMRQATIDTLIDIGNQCDGVRCDMAMLMMNPIFKKTWGKRAGEQPKTDFWNKVIPSVREAHPDMLFMAEVYWNLEHELQQQGFNYTYDKTLYDRMVNNEVGEIKAHLTAEMSYLQANIRFIENHDEPRAMDKFGVERQRPAATLICTIPGATLLHDGQFSGRRIKLPVQINRQPNEPDHPLLEQFYKRLLSETHDPIYRYGEWTQLDTQPAYKGDGDHTHNNLIVYTWQDTDEFRLIVVNFTFEWSHARLDLTHWNELSEHDWRLYDVLSESYTYREGDRISEDGLIVNIAPYDAHIYQFSRLKRVSRKQR